MNREQLLATIDDLHSQLAEIDTLDPETRAALDGVTDDIRRLLGAGDPSSESTAEEGLNGLVQHFEAQHPKIAETLGRLADGLANLGI